MARVKSRNTGPELLLRRALFAAGVRGWRCNRKDLPGKPDVAFGPARVAVFVDGGFWHGHPSKWWPGRSGDYWDTKIARNMERDAHNNESLAADGWQVLRFWDFELDKHPEDAVKEIQRALASSR